MGFVRTPTGVFLASGHGGADSAEAVSSGFVAALGGSGDRAADSRGAATTTSAVGPPTDPGALHVHGFGYDSRRDVLYVATHTGLFAASQGEQRLRRVGKTRYDTMGFVRTPTGVFLASGHGGADSADPVHLGLLRSTNRGQSWIRVSLGGESDLHAIRATGRLVYAYDAARDRMLASSDDGATWTAWTVPEAFVDIAVDPSNPRHLAAAGANAIYESLDGARSWRPVAAGISGWLAWPKRELIYVLDFTGAVLNGTLREAEWRKVGSAGNQPTAFHAVNARHLFAALHDGTIKESVNAGTTWTVRARP